MLILQQVADVKDQLKDQGGKLDTLSQQIEQYNKQQSVVLAETSLVRELVVNKSWY